MALLEYGFSVARCFICSSHVGCLQGEREKEGEREYVCVCVCVYTHVCVYAYVYGFGCQAHGTCTPIHIQIETLFVSRS